MLTTLNMNVDYSDKECWAFWKWMLSILVMNIKHSVFQYQIFWKWMLKHSSNIPVHSRVNFSFNYAWYNDLSCMFECLAERIVVQSFDCLYLLYTCYLIIIKLVPKKPPSLTLISKHTYFIKIKKQYMSTSVNYTATFVKYI